jgi:hypothetical protein
MAKDQESEAARDEVQATEPQQVPEVSKEAAPTPAPKVPIPEGAGPAAPRFTKAWRGVTLAVPRCKKCVKGRDWQKSCSHNPYFTDRQVKETVPTIVCAVCDETVIPEDGKLPEHCGQGEFSPGPATERIRFVRRPNLRDVIYHRAVSGGRGIESAMERGAVLPAELGLPSYCEFYGCRKTNPGFKASSGGIYCTEGHAKRVAQFDDPEAVEVLDANRKREQWAKAAV